MLFRSGDATYTGDMGVGTLTISPAPTKLSIPARSAKVGAKINLYAKLTRATDATALNKLIHFQIDGVDVGSSVGVAGLATLSYTVPNSLAQGAHTITAIFDGDTLYLNVTNSGGVLTVTP